MVDQNEFGPYGISFQELQHYLFPANQVSESKELPEEMKRFLLVLKRFTDLYDDPSHRQPSYNLQVDNLLAGFISFGFQVHQTLSIIDEQLMLRREKALEWKNQEDDEVLRIAIEGLQLLAVREKYNLIATSIPRTIFLLGAAYGSTHYDQFVAIGERIEHMLEEATIEWENIKKASFARLNDEEKNHVRSTYTAHNEPLPPYME